MRARLALRYSGIRVELREIDLKDKPACMLAASPKATVPVLILPDAQVIDESLDIMHWALQQNDPQHWLHPSHQSTSQRLIHENDQVFKFYLDHYKYADRFPEHSQTYYREQGELFLLKLECLLGEHRYLTGATPCIADMALLPFIRQFAYVDIQWFNQSSYVNVCRWLFNGIESELFLSIMHKQSIWKNTLENRQNPIIF